MALLLCKRQQNWLRWFIYVFFENPKSRDFLHFFAVLRTFSRTMVSTCVHSSVTKLIHIFIPWVHGSQATATMNHTLSQLKLSWTKTTHCQQPQVCFLAVFITNNYTVYNQIRSFIKHKIIATQEQTNWANTVVFTKSAVCHPQWDSLIVYRYPILKCGQLYTFAAIKLWQWQQVNIITYCCSPCQSQAQLGQR